LPTLPLTVLAVLVSDIQYKVIVYLYVNEGQILYLLFWLPFCMTFNTETNSDLSWSDHDGVVLWEASGATQGGACTGLREWRIESTFTLQDTGETVDLHCSLAKCVIFVSAAWLNEIEKIIGWNRTDSSAPNSRHWLSQKGRGLHGPISPCWVCVVTTPSLATIIFGWLLKAKNRLIFLYFSPAFHVIAQDGR